MADQEISTLERREVAIAQEPASLLQAIVALAKDPHVDVQKLDALLAMQERMEARQAEREFNEAFIAMKPELPVIEKDGRITYEAKAGKSGAAIDYATLEGIDEQVTPILQRNGFAVNYDTKRTPEGLVTVCILRHRGGHKTTTDGPPLPCDSSGGKNNIQGWGSAMKYGERYSLIAALNIRIKGKDDDGKLGGTKFITDEQAAEIEKLCAETRTDVDAFLHQFFSVVNLPNLPADNFAPAKNMLLAKKRKA